jgi:hypothetical protein
MEDLHHCLAQKRWISNPFNDFFLVYRLYFEQAHEARPFLSPPPVGISDLESPISDPTRPTY